MVIANPLEILKWIAGTMFGVALQGHLRERKSLVLLRIWSDKVDDHSDETRTDEPEKPGICCGRGTRFAEGRYLPGPPKLNPCKKFASGMGERPRSVAAGK